MADILNNQKTKKPMLLISREGSYGILDAMCITVS